MLMVVSGSASAARLSHVAANAGKALRHARTCSEHCKVGIFIKASKSKQVYTVSGPENGAAAAPIPPHANLKNSPAGCLGLFKDRWFRLKINYSCSQRNTCFTA